MSVQVATVDDVIAGDAPCALHPAPCVVTIPVDADKARCYIGRALAALIRGESEPVRGMDLRGSGI